MDRRPGLARECEIGGDGDGVAFAEAMARGLGRMQNIQVHHDGLGPFRLAAVLPVGEVIQRTDGAIHGDKGLDAGDARERVVPGITLETRLGGEQPERGLRFILESGKAEGAMERLGLGRLGVGLHHQMRRNPRRESGPLVPIVRVGDSGTPGTQLGGRLGHLDPASFALCQSVQASRGAGSACAMAR